MGHPVVSAYSSWIQIFTHVLLLIVLIFSTSGQMGAQHMVLNEEQVAFSDWMNNNLWSDTDVNHLLPLDVRNMI